MCNRASDLQEETIRMNLSKPSPATPCSVRIGALLSLVLAGWILPLTTGCGGSQPPKELSPDQIPAAVEGAFQHADDELRQAASNLVAAVEGGEDAQAYLQLQVLLNRPDLTQEQRDLVSRAMIGIGARLQEAIDAGDPDAIKLMEAHGAYR